jgi:hypothetical protein
MANKNFKTDITADGDISGKYLKATNSTGDEGGEILLSVPQTNTTIAGTGVTVDVFQNKLRFFEQGGDARGYYLDITGGGAGVTTNIIGGGSASDSFKTISVTGQSSVVADSSTDTLSLIAGTNVSITTDATADSITINSTGAYTSVDSITYPDYITFDTTPETVPTATGSIFWDDGDGLPATVLNANVTIGLGQEQIALSKNATGASIAKGKVVYINGAAGQRPTIALSDADTEATSSKTFGLTAEAIADGAEGFVATFGVLRGVNTLGLTEGAALWLSSTAGSYTTTVPAEPAHSVFLGYVVKAHATAGEIFVNIQNGYELTELHGVIIDGTPADNEVLAYDSTSGLWINQTASEAGIAALSGAVFTGNIELDVSRKLVFDGTTDEAYKTTLYIVDPTNDREILLPDAGGTLALTGDITTIVGDYIPLTQKGAAQGVAELDIDTLVPVEQIPDLSATYLTPTAADLDYQPLDADLTAIAALTANGILKKTSGTWGMDTATYLTSYTETDPVFVAHPAYGITSTKIGNWDSAYGWGDHSLASYASGGHNHSLNSLSNVVITGTPSDGQAIVWDTTTSKWVNETVSGGGASYPTQSGNNGKFLQTDGSTVSWQNVDLSGYQLLDQDLTDIAALTANGFLKKTSGVWAMDASTYLTSESDTLETVTDRGATSSNAITISNTTQSTTPTSGALIVSGGVGIAKDVWIDGNLHVNGTTITENTQTVATHDNLIYLNAALDTTITNAVGDGTYVTYTAENSYTPGMDIRVTGMNPSGYNISSADLLTVYSATSTQFVVAKTTTGTFVSGGTAHAKEEANPDLGFAGGYYNAGYAHAGLFRDATDGVFKFFDGYTPEPDEAVNIDTTHASFALADISANDATFTGEAKVGGAIVKTTVTSITPSSTTVIAGFPYQDSVGGVVVAECIVLLSSTSDGSYYTSKILVGGGYPAGTPTANLTEYAIIEDGSMDVTFTADLGSLGGGGGGNTHVFLKALVTNSNVTAKVISTSITASNAAT